MIEIWKDIADYEGQYMVSNLGRVKSLEHKLRNGHIWRERVLAITYCEDKYGRILLSKNNNHKRFLIHRLVAEAFLENPDNLPQVNHKDENPKNNTVDNLEWCTAKYNNNYGTHNDRMRKTQGKPVVCVETGIVYQSAREIKRKLGYNNTLIGACCKSKNRTAYGYHWKYVE